MIEKTIYYVQLFDYYRSLLTERQREMLALYYEEDYSLAEIGEFYAISRQGVYDNIRRGTEMLDHLEAELQLYQRSKQRAQLIDKISDYIEDDDYKEYIRQLREIN